MPLSLSIEPFSSSIHLYDSPHTQSQYSLSGHIVISFSSSSSSFFPSPNNLLLTSLHLTFEGHSELVLDSLGYTPLRIIQIDKHLVQHPLPISATHEWRIVFDLQIPGWLPASAIFGDDDLRSAGISYSLHARARFLSADDDSSIWTNICAAVRFPPRSLHAQPVPIHLTRFVSAPEHDFPSSTYSIQVSEVAKDATNVPPHLLQSLQVHAIAPTRTSISDSSIPLTLRIQATADHLRVLGFEADVIQLQSFQTSPSPSYRSRFPLPPSSQQPPTQPLKSPHPLSALWELGLVVSPEPNSHLTRELSLIPSGARKVFRVRGADTDAHQHGVPLDSAWLRMEANIPLADNGTVQVTSDSPFLDVHHELRIRLSIAYDADPGRITSDELVFCLPLEFVKVAPPHAATAFLPGSSVSLPLLRTRAPSPTVPPALPAYNQLFYENGDRKHEGGLPLYREKEDEGESSEGESSEEGESSLEGGESSEEEESDSPATPCPDSPRAPLLADKRMFGVGESFLVFDDADVDADADGGGDVQFGIAF